MLTQEVVAPSGYTLIDQLGSGGFGEVWRASAPGGVEKAVKIVFGHFEEELAARELKSLERVRDVRHPFLLSVERYEVVNGRLAIVTELADTSLDKRFKECRRDGLPGIPRDELLRYLSDAAEALDCLSERHGLQHLDVKPENLLVLGDHVKVADFGLVKELGVRTINSMIGGMTPLYSPPEVYDDAPSMFSDQYSLAVVYQQMLTGVLPFSGRTPAQLAKQHTMMRPNVSVLSESDQAPVLRALAKKPEDRFANSCQFVAALKGGEAQAVAPSAPPLPSKHETPAGPDDTKSILALSTTPIGQPDPVEPDFGLSPLAAAAPPVDREFREVSGEVNEVRIPDSLKSLPTKTAPTLIVSAGGLGTEMLAAFAALRGAENGAGANVEWLAIDTDRADLRDQARELERAVDRDAFLHLPLHRPKHYADASEKLLHWLSRRWLYNIPRSLTTRGYRPLGRLALIDNAEDARRAIEARLRRLLDRNEAESIVNVVLLASASGGTGSGVAIELAQALRSIGAELGVATTIAGFFATTVGREKNETDALPAGNSIAFLTELAHAQSHGNAGAAPHDQAAAPFLGEGSPFDELYTVPFGKRRDRRRTLASVAAYLELHTSTDLNPAFGCEPMADGGSEPSDESPEPRFRVFAAVRPSAVRAERCAALGDMLRGVLAREWTRPALPEECAPGSLFTRGLGDKRDGALAQAVARCIASRVPPPPPKKKKKKAPPPEPPPEPDPKQVIAFLDGCEQIAAASPRADGVEPDGRWVTDATERIVSRIVDDETMNASGLAELLETIIGEATRAAANDGSDDYAPLLATNQLECSQTRTRMLIRSSADESSPKNQRLPDVPVVSGGATPTVLVALGAGVDFRDLASRTAEGVDSVGDAATRLYARQDIAWEDLREVVTPV